MPELGEQTQPIDPQSSPELITTTAVDQFSKLLELYSRYSSQDLIPAVELADIGYERVTLPDGGTKLTPIQLNRERALLLAEKYKHIPFSELPVQYTSIEKMYRFIQDKDMIRLKAKIERLDFINIFERKFNFNTIEYFRELDESSALVLFQEDFKEYLGSYQSEDNDQLGPEMVENAIFQEFTAIPLVGYISDRMDIPKFDNYTEEDSDFVKFIPRGKSKELFSDIDRVYGVVDDVTYLSEKISHDLEADIDVTNFEDMYPEMSSYLERNSIRSQYQFIVHFFAKYLSSLDQNEISIQLASTNSMDEARQLLQQTSFSSRLNEDERRLKNAMKIADINQKKVLSGDLKEIKEKKKKLRQLQNGMQQFFSMPEYISEVFHKAVKDVQASLVTGNNEEDEIGALYLVGTPDPDRDHDPGKISGDCTEGRPLPFDRPELPVYNIKVLDDEKNYIGNMYLLVTRDIEGKPVWHFDAIQIPKSTLNWSKTVASLVDSLVPAALEKGIQSITVNQEDHHISNYDYIQEAVIHYASGNSHGRTKVDMLEGKNYPGKNEKYSNFQGTGEALVLWKQSKDVE